MEDSNVIKLPVTEEPAAQRKRPAAPKPTPGSEAKRRLSNVQRLAALSETDGSVRLLEELLFGAEDQLLHRLVEVTHLTSVSS